MNNSICVAEDEKTNAEWEDYVVESLDISLRASTKQVIPEPKFPKSLRSVMIIYVISLKCRFDLRNEVLFCAVNLVDRYTALTNIISPNDLRLISTVCMLIAAKYHNCKSLKFKDCVETIKEYSTRKEILETEINVLATLQYEIEKNDLWTLLNVMSHSFNLPSIITNIAGYYCVSSLFLNPKFKPLQIVTASILIGAEYAHRGSDCIKLLCTYRKITNDLSHSELQRCVDFLQQLQLSNQSKYAVMKVIPDEEIASVISLHENIRDR